MQTALEDKPYCRSYESDLFTQLHQWQIVEGNQDGNVLYDHNAIWGLPLTVKSVLCWEDGLLI